MACYYFRWKYVPPVTWNNTKFNIISLIFGPGQALRFHCLFKFQKSLRNLTQFVFGLGWEKEDAHHSESFDYSRIPNFTSILTSFMNIATCILVLDNGANKQVLRHRLNTNLPKGFSKYPVFHRIDFQIFSKYVEVFLVFWILIVDTDCPWPDLGQHFCALNLKFHVIYVLNLLCPRTWGINWCTL